MSESSPHSTSAEEQRREPESESLLGRISRFCLEQKLVVVLLVMLLVGWGMTVAPFDWDFDWLPRDPVPVDAIPNLGENQQIVFTEWPGRSPQDVEDQVTYPLTVALMGVPGVREVRSNSMFGFSSIFVIFEEDIEFYWSRGRIIEKLDSLPAGTLPEDADPGLGPDATALGQIYWYTLEGRDPDGEPVGGWDLHELRSIQDWYVRYGLLSARGISEVASVGGYVQEYQVDVDPDAMRAHNVTIGNVFDAVRTSNLDVGARTTEINRVEYLVRGRGFIESLDDIEQAVVRLAADNVPIRVRDVAHVTLGPAERRGALDRGGAETVGGVVVVREGFNPLEAIQNVRAQIEEISPGLPTKPVIDWGQVGRAQVAAFAEDRGFSAFASPGIDEDAWMSWLNRTPRDQWPEWITTSKVTIESFYDRTGLIQETLATLNDALVQQILVTVIVVILMLMHLRSAVIISAMLPLAVLMTFITMKLFGVDANVVALAGIAIAIGTIVDMGIIVTENVMKHLDEADIKEPRLDVVHRGVREVGSAVLTAIATTVISFLPVFTMTGAEGKMFVPLAYTKTFVLIAAVIIALTVVPAAVHVFIAGRINRETVRRALLAGLGVAGVLTVMAGVLAGSWVVWAAGLALVAAVIVQLTKGYWPGWLSRGSQWGASIAATLAVTWVLANVWEPLGPEPGFVRNYIFVVALIGGLLLGFRIFEKFYGPILRACLAHKAVFLALPALLVIAGLSVWLGFERVFAFAPAAVERVGLSRDLVEDRRAWEWASNEFPGLGREFMPAFDEGSFLWMPTTMPHASIGEALDVMQYQDMAFEAIPEVREAVGKIGRAESPLDPAPVSMIETVINYYPEYRTDEDGRRINFKYDREAEEFVRDEDGELIEDPGGRPYRQWRDHIQSPDDIWNEIVDAGDLPGTTSAPKLQPIETRQVMLQTGMRAPIGVKLRGPDLETLDRMAIVFEEVLREVDGINPATVNADRVVGKPYLEIDIDREAVGNYGLSIVDVQDVISTAIGGQTVTRTVEGRERFPVRVRYQRELRNEIEDLERVLVPGQDGSQVPLSYVADVEYVRGPQVIKSEDTFLVAYVTFGPAAGMTEVDVVEEAQAHLDELIERGELSIPAGVSYTFAGEYEHQVRAAQTLAVVLPVALFLIFMILYLQFKSVMTTLMVFSGIAIAWAGGFFMLYLFGQEWFADFHVFGVNMRDLFQLRAINLSVAVWVGFLALFGIAVDDGVVIATYLRQSFAHRRTQTIQEIRDATVAAGLRRVRPCLMTSATTILALLPVLTSTGRGSDIMLPMAIPSVGGMSLVLLTMFSVPVLYCLVEEIKLKAREKADQITSDGESAADD